MLKKNLLEKTTVDVALQTVLQPVSQLSTQMISNRGLHRNDVDKWLVHLRPIMYSLDADDDGGFKQVSFSVVFASAQQGATTCPQSDRRPLWGTAKAHPRAPAGSCCMPTRREESS